jgi:hypothetical protein
MPVKIREAERITGYEIWPDESLPKYTFVAWDGTVEIARAGGKSEKDALRALVQDVYRIHSRIVIKEQKYLCGRCGKRKSLSVHHKVHRSKGRSDALTNLIALCSDCHREEHGGF